MEMKNCNQCKTNLPINHFETKKVHRVSIDGKPIERRTRRGVCKSCRQGKILCSDIRSTGSRRGYIKGETLRNRLLRHNISEENYNELKDIQNSKCYTCSESLNPQNEHIDHCHTTGKVRGLLCRNCNLGLGNFKDNLEVLIKAMEYLNNPPNYELIEKRIPENKLPAIISKYKIYIKKDKPEVIKKEKPLYLFNINKQLVGVYEGITDLSIVLNINKSQVAGALRRHKGQKYILKKYLPSYKLEFPD